MPQYANRLIKALRKYEKRKVVDLGEFRSAKAEAATLAEEATSDELLKDLEPEHRVLAAAHNLLWWSVRGPRSNGGGARGAPWGADFDIRRVAKPSLLAVDSL